MYDIIVIGGGPAGMTAALYALRNGKSVLILEKNGFGGQITYSPKVENIPGFASVSGNAFADSFLDQILNQGAEIELEEATGITDCGNVKKVSTASGKEYEAICVIITVGVRHRMLGLPGEEELIGNGISFCAVCDGDFYTGKKVAVAGGGNSAFVEAVLLAEKCSEVVMLQDLPYFTAEEKLQNELLSHGNVTVHFQTRFVSLLEEDGLFRGILIEDKQTGKKTSIECDGLFEAVGLIPENELFREFCDLDERGYFDADDSGKTKTPGIFVAGDCRKKQVRQVTTACADGAQAALQACEYIRTLK